jgi:hypothetical protein
MYRMYFYLIIITQQPILVFNCQCCIKCQYHIISIIKSVISFTIWQCYLSNIQVIWLTCWGISKINHLFQLFIVYSYLHWDNVIVPSDLSALSGVVFKGHTLGFNQKYPLVFHHFKAIVLSVYSVICASLKSRIILSCRLLSG